MNIIKILGAFFLVLSLPGFTYAGHNGKVCTGFVYETEERGVVFFFEDEAECIEPEEHKDFMDTFVVILFDLPRETHVKYLQESWTDERGVCHTRLLLVENYVSRDVLYALGKGKGMTKPEAFQDALKNARESITPISRIKPKKA